MSRLRSCMQKASALPETSRKSQRMMWLRTKKHLSGRGVKERTMRGWAVSLVPPVLARPRRSHVDFDANERIRGKIQFLQ